MIAGHRLHSTLFAVALFHGLLVLGVTFAPEKDSGEGIPTLEVVMLIEKKKKNNFYIGVGQLCYV